MLNLISIGLLQLLFVNVIIQLLSFPSVYYCFLAADLMLLVAVSHSLTCSVDWLESRGAALRLRSWMMELRFDV